MILALTAAAATTLVALPTPAGQNGKGPGTGRTTVAVIEGVVDQFLASPGLGTPELVVTTEAGTSATFTLGPFFWLTDQGFEADHPDRVEITVLTCAGSAGGVAVIQVYNVTRDLLLLLRDPATGRPLWRSETPHQGLRIMVRADRPLSLDTLQEVLEEGRHIDIGQLAWFDGAFVRLTGAHALGVPTLVLEIDGTETQFLVSPYWVLLAENHDVVSTLSESGTLEVYAAPAIIEGETLWVAFTIKLSSGLELVLRDPYTGHPVHRN